MDASTRDNELLAQERRFWNAMMEKDGPAAARMTDDGCIVVGAQGVSSISAKSMEKMTAEGPWQLQEFTFDEKTMQRRFLTDDIAVVAYKVSEKIVVGGKALSLDAYDASVWMRRGEKWMCVLHTESVAGDPFGRQGKGGDKPADK